MHHAEANPTPKAAPLACQAEGANAGPYRSATPPSPSVLAEIDAAEGEVSLAAGYLQRARVQATALLRDSAEGRALLLRALGVLDRASFFIGCEELTAEISSFLSKGGK